MNKIFLCGGRTGGPIVPILAISSHLKNQVPYIVGVKDGFERVVSSKKQISFLRLLEAKMGVLSFGKQSLFQTLVSIPNMLLAIVLIIINSFLSIVYLIIHKPKLILSAGGFTAVPIIYSAKLLSTIGIIKTSIIIHQQDAIPGLTNKLTAKYADLLTCVYPKSIGYKVFSKAETIPNPIDETVYTESSLAIYSNAEPFKSFLLLNSLPILVIYGGGSGAKAINNWVLTEYNNLCKKFRVIHLIGELQVDTKQFFEIENKNYLPFISLLNELPLVLSVADLVISRAGLGAITELSYLEKQAFLVPLPNSHQEENAPQEAKKFGILEQKNMDNWLSAVLNYKEILPKPEFQQKVKYNKQLAKYYTKIQSLLDKK